MNLKQIKIDLTVKLMNLKNQSNTLQTIQDSMVSFKEEIGNFLDVVILNDLGLSPSIVKRTYAMRFEKCTLNVDLVVNQTTKSEYINGFSMN
jgi:hypothetical protein